MTEERQLVRSGRKAIRLPPGTRSLRGIVSGLVDTPRMPRAKTWAAHDACAGPDRSLGLPPQPKDSMHRFGARMSPSANELKTPEGAAAASNAGERDRTEKLVLSYSDGLGARLFSDPRPGYPGSLRLRSGQATPGPGATKNRE
jgi:hypothetical protein